MRFFRRSVSPVVKGQNPVRPFSSSMPTIASTNPKIVLDQIAQRIGNIQTMQSMTQPMGVVQKTQPVEQLKFVMETIIKAEKAYYEQTINHGHTLLAKHEVAKARLCFDGVIKLLEEEKATEGNFTVDSRTIAKAYLGRALAYFGGSAVHSAQVLGDLEKAIQYNPNSELAKAKKKEYEAELGLDRSGPSAS